MIFYTGRTSLGFWSGGLIQRSAARTVDLVIEWESNSDGMGAGAAARSKRNEPCRFGLTAAAANPIDALPPQNGSSNLLFFILLLLLLPFFSFLHPSFPICWFFFVLPGPLMGCQSNYASERVCGISFCQSGKFPSFSKKKKEKSETGPDPSVFLIHCCQCFA